MDQLSKKSESPSFRLPEVQVEPQEPSGSFEGAPKNTTEQSMAKAVESNAAGHSLNNAIPANQTVSNMVDPASLASPIGKAKDDSATTKIVVTDGLPANDSDLIEKAWVVKAKAIVEETKNDPYEQSNEIKKIRNDYLKKRFNSNVKADKE